MFTRKHDDIDGYLQGQNQGTNLSTCNPLTATLEEASEGAQLRHFYIGVLTHATYKQGQVRL